LLEKELDITDDPRGVYLAADAIRILYGLGLGSEMPVIGHGQILLDESTIRIASLISNRTPGGPISSLELYKHACSSHESGPRYPAAKCASRDLTDATGPW
jgi:hypothetical protein